MSRSYLRIPLTITDRHDQATRGLVTDISVGGFRTRGIASRLGDRNTFLIHAGEITDADDIEVRATCKWCKAEAPEKNLHEAGYRIDGVSDEGASEIKKLIRLLSIGDRNRRRG